MSALEEAAAVGVAMATSAASAASSTGSSEDPEIGSRNASGHRLLPKTFAPSVNEVIIGRGRRVWNHSGNERFQDLVQSHMYEYSRATTKTSKSAIISRVLTQVKQASSVGGFVKQESSTKRWYAMEEASARISTAQAFRDSLSHTYRSSKQFKQQRRWNSRVSSTTGTTTPSIHPAPGQDQGQGEHQDTNLQLLPRPVRSINANSTYGTNTGPGLRGILNSALGIMGEDAEETTNDGVNVNMTMISRIQQKKNSLDALLDTYASGTGTGNGAPVEWTQNPFEPTPLPVAPIGLQQHTANTSTTQPILAPLQLTATANGNGTIIGQVTPIPEKTASKDQAALALRDVVFFQV
ncbi:Nitrilase family, member 2 [Seminavis robusta]|uniref:Nitrilase family, member 2 n=1 Tax=Seminavis robusta TaxID=568900 RepID=A0A9N8DT67_9STRA|nr:Nitrilase family, member 2 [Seminavis robusta]|eukprot:Sro270_g104230.1 Nitrilase family, member 2 (352) ;mRNA; f:34341-35519